jgi:hypothetical protein
MRGKEKCKALKEIRRQIALNNEIEYAVSECSHKGECKGTCPKCEAEVRYLERELELRRNLGKKVVLAGIGVGVAASMAGCTNPVQDYVIDPVVSFFGGNTGADRLEGETTYAPPEVMMGEAAPIEVDGGIVEPVSECGSEEIIELDGDVEYIPEAGEIVSEEEENISEEEDNIQEDGNINQEE